MYSTWVDNDQQNDAAGRRIESASKKLPSNRIQVYQHTDLEFPKSIRDHPAISPHLNISWLRHPNTWTRPALIDSTKHPSWEDWTLPTSLHSKRTNRAAISSNSCKSSWKLLKKHMKIGLNNNSNKAVCTPIFKASELSKLKIKIQNNT